MGGSEDRTRRFGNNQEAYNQNRPHLDQVGRYACAGYSPGGLVRRHNGGRYCIEYLDEIMDIKATAVVVPRILQGWSDSKSKAIEFFQNHTSASACAREAIIQMREQSSK